MILRNLATKLIIYNEGKVIFFHGGYDDFLDRIGWEDEPKKAPKKPKEEKKPELAAASSSKKKKK